MARRASRLRGLHATGAKTGPRRVRGKCDSNAPRSCYRFALGGLVLAACQSASAIAQTSCPISSSYNGQFVSQSSGTCAIVPGTTLAASPFPNPTSINADTATITANGVTINWQNGQGIAAHAQNGGVIIFGVDPVFGGSIINEGVNGGGQNIGLLAEGANSQIIADGLTVNFGGAGNNVGARALNGGTITLNEGTNITFTRPGGAGGGQNTGLWASGPGSSIITNGATVLIPNSGGNDTGALADGGANISLNGGSVTVQGLGGGETGLLARGTGSRIEGIGVDVSVSSQGGNARGGFLENGGTIALADSSVMTRGGSGSYGFLFQAPAGITNTLTLDGTTVDSASDAFAARGGIADIATTKSTVTSQNGNLLSAAQNAVVTFTNDGSTLTGVILTDGSSTSDVTLSSGTIWNMTGSSNATNLINDESQILVTEPTGNVASQNAYKTLTVVNYDGSRGEIVLNTFLGVDDSPSDQLIINGGRASGSTTLLFRNTSGDGAMTVADGIPVVVTRNGGTTQSDAFSLGGLVVGDRVIEEVRGGAYTYYLFRGGLTGGRPDDWFLRSDFIVPPPSPEPSPPPPVVPGNTLPPTPPPGSPGALPPGLYPIIGPELATYGAVQPLARQIGLITLGTLNRRIGDTMTFANAGDVTGFGASQWARIYGQRIDNHYQAYADPRSEGWIGGLQGGIDLWRGHTFGGHRDAIGATFALGRGMSDVTGLVTNSAATGYVLTRTGSLDLDAYAFGGYWTHYAPAGWYLDAVVLGTAYRGDATTRFVELPVRGTGFIASLEAGIPIPLPLGPNFVLEPQTQIIWQQVRFDAVDDGLGMVALGETSDPTGRVGVRGQWSFTGARGVLWQPYTGINFWHDWGADVTNIYSGTDRVLLVQEATRADVFGGLTAKLGPRLSLYAQSGYEFAVDNDDYDREGIQGNAGLRWAW